MSDLEIQNSHAVPNTVVGDCLVVFSMALFGTYSLFLRFCPHIPTVVFLLAFQIVGATILGVHQIFARRAAIGRKDWLLLLALALACSGNDLCYFLAFRHTSIANAAVAHQTVSIFLLLLAPMLLKERTTRAEWYALAVALLGVGVLYSDHLGINHTHDLVGISLGLLSGLFYACLIVLYRRLHLIGLNLPTINWWRYFFSSILLLPLLFGLHWQPNGADILVLTSFGVLFAIIASSIHIYAMSRTRAMHVSIIGKSEPVFATLYAFLFLHEMPTMQALLGGFLIIGSSLWLALTSHTESL